MAKFNWVMLTKVQIVAVIVGLSLVVPETKADGSPSPEEMTLDTLKVNPQETDADILSATHGDNDDCFKTAANGCVGSNCGTIPAPAPRGDSKDSGKDRKAKNEHGDRKKRKRH